MTDKTIIVGAGLTGLTTALELLSRGHSVHVLEAASAVGQVSSFANGGLLIPSSSHPWNRPGFYRHFLSSVFGANRAVIYRAAGMPAMIPWLLRFIRNCSVSRHQAAMEGSYRLAALSIERMSWLRQEVSFDYGAILGGSLKVCRSQQELDLAAAQAGLLLPYGLQFDVLDRQQTMVIEPALSDMGRHLHGSIFAPDDEGGDSGRFCRGLGDEILARGGEISLSTRALAVQRNGSAVNGIETEQGHLEAERVIVCTGVLTASLLRPLGVRLAICPVKGYSLTLDGVTGERCPGVPVMDDSMYGGVLPLGSGLRVAGVAEFGGTDVVDNEACIEHLFRLLAGLFPTLASEIDRSCEIRWAGLRPVSADGLPYIGESPIGGLWVNSGHGSLGFTLAAGSAHILADMIEGRAPAIEPGPYRIART